MYSWSWDFRALWGNRVSTTFFSLALSVNLPMKGKENDTHTLAQNHRELHNHFEKKKNHCHPSFFPFFPHQQSWRQSLLKVSRSMGEVASQPGRVGHGRRNWWGNFSVSVTIQGNATVCLFSSVFRFCTGFRIFLAWFIVDVHQPWLLPHLILGETKTALRERFYSRVQVQYKLHTLSLFMDYNLFNHEYREMYIKDKPMDGHVTLFNSTWSLLLYYPPPLLLLPTSLMTLLCVCLQVPYSPVTLGPNDLHITQPLPCPYVSVIVIFLLTNDITLIFTPSSALSLFSRPWYLTPSVLPLAP